MQAKMASNFLITYTVDWHQTPGAYWVHIPIVGGDEYTPPAPKPIPGKGYAILQVPFGAHVLEFCSAAQLQHYIDVLSQKLLPTTTQLSAQRGSGAGPNGHWLSRLPAELKPYSKRVLLVKKLKAALEYAAAHAPGTAFKSVT
jgi:hypothetical protein